MSDKIRTCMICRKSRHKEEMHRIMSTPEGTLVYDARNKGPGRGSYVCTDCLSDFSLDYLLSSRNLSRAFRRSVDDALVQSLRHEFEELCVAHSDVQ